MEAKYYEMGLYYVMEVSTEVNIYNISDFKKILMNLVNTPHENIAIALNANLNFMDSSVIGTLIAAQKKKQIIGGKIALTNITASVEEILSLAGLGDFFTLFHNEDELMESLG